MKCTVDEFLHIANHDMDKRKPFRSLVRRSNFLLVNTAIPDMAFVGIPGLDVLASGQV